MKVLLVEDHAMMRAELRHIIATLGHEVIEAENGSKAVEKLFGANHILDTSINAIITDMRMPGTSGLWLLQYLNAERSAIPCLLHSTDHNAREDGRNIDLKEVPLYFDFVTFHLKGDSRYIREFLNSIHPAQAQAG
jgi:CheY-like chemotaxis protein